MYEFLCESAVFYDLGVSDYVACRQGHSFSEICCWVFTVDFVEDFSWVDADNKNKRKHEHRHRNHGELRRVQQKF